MIVLPQRLNFMLKKVFFVILAGIFFAGSVAFASCPPRCLITPGETSYSSRYTLTDIYNRLSSLTDSYPEHTFAPQTVPNSTLKTLADLWSVVSPAVLLSAGNLSSGVFPAGTYASTTDLTLIEPNLTAENISRGKIIFGVTGTCKPFLTTRLVSHWPLDGNADDIIGGNNGTLYGATSTAGVKGLPDTAYLFDGAVGTTIELSNYDFSNKSITVSAWMKLSDPHDWVTIIGDRNTDSDYPFLFVLNPNSHYMSFFSSDLYPVEFDSNIVMDTTQWHHVVVVFDNTAKTVTFYIDGVADMPKSFTGSVSDTANHTAIAANWFDGKWLNNMKGSIDNVRLYDRVLAVDEIQDIYNIEKP